MASGMNYGKAELAHEEVLHDHDLKVSKEEALHVAGLTEAEKVIENKLRRKIDGLVMPLVILV
ncbi:hypothetical protein LTR86_001949 [Recurvomyces mirabilis]|nr:hypothetical protein LTR86_001949 [Recurvomyces mirabilis]